MRTVFLMLMASLLAIPAMAQSRQFDPERMAEMKVKMYTRALHIDESKQEAFTKTFNVYQKELTELMQIPSLLPEGGDIAETDVSESDADAIIQFEIEKQRSILDIRQKYLKEFKKVLSPAQILRFYMMENNPRMGRGGRPQGMDGQNNGRQGSRGNRQRGFGGGNQGGPDFSQGFGGQESEFD